MDALTLATSFATVISLISEYRSLNKENETKSYQDFLNWLAENRHQELKVLIESNQNTIVSIKAILNEDFNEISRKLESINNKLAYILSSDELFSNLAMSLAPQKILSVQAQGILKRFEELKASRMLVFNSMPSSTYTFEGGERGNLILSDKRFIQDDLNLLVNLSLLTHEIDKYGTNIYTITRSASELVKTIGS